MPVVEISYMELARMVGAHTSQVRIMLPFLGLDIEHEDGDMVRIEYSPNRPDYSTVWGMALGLQGLLDVQTGPYQTIIHDSDMHLMADDSILNIRPAITSVAARNGTLNRDAIGQIISMQEDLHNGLGRQRKRLAIGLHDMDTLQFPLRYMAVDRDVSFPPLGRSDAIPIHRIIDDTPQGVSYGSLLADGPVPVIMDNHNTILSMPPIINSNHTTITESTRNILVDVTGQERRDVENAIAIISTTLQAAGFEIHVVHVSGVGNRTPPFDTTTIHADAATANRLLGLNMTSEDMIRYLRRCRLDAQIKNGEISCQVPAYRFDMLGPMDVIEELALGYGIHNMEPQEPPIGVAGYAHPEAIQLLCLDRIMTGLGYTQVINSSLTREETAHIWGVEGMMRVADSKSSGHNTLRKFLLPGLLECLSRNIHEPYPHRLYETGMVFSDMKESMHLCVVSAYNSASYSDIKAVLESVMSSMGGKVSTPPYDERPFKYGHAARILYGDTPRGYVGEISEDILAGLRMRGGISVAAFEMEVNI